MAGEGTGQWGARPSIKETLQAMVCVARTGGILDVRLTLSAEDFRALLLELHAAGYWPAVGDDDPGDVHKLELVTCNGLTTVEAME